MLTDELVCAVRAGVLLQLTFIVELFAAQLARQMPIAPMDHIDVSLQIETLPKTFLAASLRAHQPGFGMNLFVHFENSTRAKALPACGTEERALVRLRPSS